MKTVIGLFNTSEEAETSVRRLQEIGFGASEVTILRSLRALWGHMGCRPATFVLKDFGRGVRLRRARPFDQRHLPRLPHAHDVGPAYDRHGAGGGAQSGPSLWRARGRRGADCAAGRRRGQRYLSCHWRTHDRTAHVAAPNHGSAVGQGKDRGKRDQPDRATGCVRGETLLYEVQ